MGNAGSVDGQDQCLQACEVAGTVSEGGHRLPVGLTGYKFQLERAIRLQTETLRNSRDSRHAFVRRVLPAQHCHTEPAGNRTAHRLLEYAPICARATDEDGALVTVAQEVPGIRVRHR